MTCPGESSGKLYHLGKPCFTWGRETIFETKLKTWKFNKEQSISVGSVGFVD